MANVHSSSAANSASLVNGDAVSVTNPSVGQYVVTFARNVKGCAASFTPGFSGGSGDTNNLTVGQVDTDGTTAATVSVADTTDPVFTQVNTSFHLILVC
jgi:hypothetical protein